MKITINHPTKGTIILKNGDSFAEKVDEHLTPAEYRKKVQLHEERVLRLAANDYFSKKQKTQDENRLRFEENLIDFWRECASVEVDTHGKVK